MGNMQILSFGNLKSNLISMKIIQFTSNTAYVQNFYQKYTNLELMAQPEMSNLYVMFASCGDNRVSQLIWEEDYQVK